MPSILRFRLFAAFVFMAGVAAPAGAQQIASCPMCIAAASGDTAEVLRLIENGEDTEKRVAYGGTAIMYAARHGHAETFRQMILKGANARVQDARGLNLLWIATMADHINVISVLVESGQAEYTLSHAHPGWSPLLYAARYGYADIVDFIGGGDSFLGINLSNGQSFNGVTPLMMAAAAGHDEVAAVLLPDVDDLNIKNDDGTNALMFAAYYGNLDIVNLLLENGANLNATDNDGRTALMHSAIAGQAAVMERFNAAPLSVREAVDSGGFSWEDYQNTGGRTDIADYLRQFPPSPSKQNFDFVLAQ